MCYQDETMVEMSGSGIVCGTCKEAEGGSSAYLLRLNQERSAAPLLDADNALAMANMAQLTVNLFCVWVRNTETGSRQTLLFALGITLFAGCDYAIFVRTLAERFLSTAHPVYVIAAFTVWTCYIPARVFLLRSYVEKIIFTDCALPAEPDTKKVE